MHKQRIFNALLVLSLINLVACSGVQSSPSAKGPVLSATDSFAIDLTGKALEAEYQHPSDGQLEVELRRSLSDSLKERGLTEVPANEADWLVLPSLRVLKKMQKNDPYFAFDTVVEYEQAELKLELLDASTAERSWSGTRLARLRPLRRGSGLYSVRMVELDRDRDWAIGEMAADLVRAIP